jgi:pimeloyl-ACP methyl ester carboxylesterase
LSAGRQRPDNPHTESRDEEVAMPIIDINDTTIYYEQSGQEAALLFVHGMCGDAEVWADQARRLSDRYTCVRYDRRGHTRSGRGRVAISAVQHADDAAALIEALGLAPCLIVGSSGGAAIAAGVALRHGHLLRGAVLSEPPLFSLDPAAGQALIDELRPRLDAAMATDCPTAAVDAFFSLICPGLWAKIDDVRKDRYRNNADIGFTDLRSPSLDIAPADLAAVTLPVLVIAGSASHPSLRAIAHRLAAALPDARLIELADCGHVTYAEQPDAFAHAVLTFATELDRRPATASN